MCPRKRKSSGLRSGERGGHATGPPRPIHRAGYVTFKKCRDSIVLKPHVSLDGERNNLQQTGKHLFQEATVCCVGQTVWQDVTTRIPAQIFTDVRGDDLLMLDALLFSASRV
ncbi:hypothetical protein AVEN_267724-1 [Araneus ventricosus]|uniref:Uncharacterized protein n=1 Tax=Araneus ventricosus TaxID=182803 RepID=A0A4Y2CXK8_ARAVE|nr:hypothetical protein AVEN_267724-1 [Araneus ventricosus]